MSESMLDDHQLVRRYAAEGSETAFAELVERYVNLVYSAALRRLGGDGQLAQDVVQLVFTDLARKAHSLSHGVVLAGWLHQATRYAAAQLRRTERRRQAREQEAVFMNTLQSEPMPEWTRIRPLLDDALDRLGRADRDALILRYFEQRSLAEVGQFLGLNEDAARKRVNRALDKLRAALARSGVTSTAAALDIVLTGKTVELAPPGLAMQVAHRACTAGAAGMGLTASLGQLLTVTKAKVVGTGAVVVVAIILMIVNHHGRNPAGAVSLASPNKPIVSAATPTSPGAETAANAVASSNALVLHFVAADNGSVIPNVEVEFWSLGQKGREHGQLRATRFGVCNLPVSRDAVKQLVVVNQVDGFAETRLEWRPDRGETIPSQYTLRLVRSVPIGGMVMDPDGYPVSGARISFANRVDPAVETRPESHDFTSPFRVAGVTDANGRWRIDRIARETVHTIFGAASHPEFVPSAILTVAGNPDAEQQLLASKYVFRLGRAASVRGIVMDPDGKPVPNAKVQVGSFSPGESPREIQSRTDGTFFVTGCRPGKGWLRAEAERLVPAKLEIEIGTNAVPLRVTLSRGNLLRLKVVDKQGAPVSHAIVSFNQPATLSESPQSPIQLSRITGADGRAECYVAPERSLIVSAEADGYGKSEEATMQPDGQEHEIVLSPALRNLTISGTVRDAATGRRIPRFRIVTGRVGTASMGGATNVTWGDRDTDWMSFEGGQFTNVFTGAGRNTDPDSALVFKFEADGYAPFITRGVRPDEGEVPFDIRLRAAAATTVTVLLPDGRPAANADVGLVFPGAGLRLAPGGFARSSLRSEWPSSGDSLLMADASGHFRLPDNAAVQQIVVAHPEGYAETTPAALTAEPVLRLQPWGRLEGTDHAGRELQLEFGEGNLLRSIFCDPETFKVSTDAAGHFVFPQVPPGRRKLARFIPRDLVVGRGRVTGSFRPLMDVEIRPGETTTVTLGNLGYTVTLRLRWPDTLKRQPDWNVVVSLQTPLPQPPAETANDPQARAAWRLSPEAQAAFANIKHRELAEGSDGVFSTDDVPAGNYDVNAGVYERSGDARLPKLLAAAQASLTVPADPPTGTLDLGEITLKARP